MRKSKRPFDPEAQILLEAVAEYASTALLNLNLVRNLQGNVGQRLSVEADSATTSLDQQDAFREFASGMRKELAIVNAYVGMLVDEQLGELNEEQLDALRIAKEKLHTMVALLETGIDQQGS
jgi:hypothetical protein